MRACGVCVRKGMVSNALSMRSIESGTLDMHVALFDPREAVDQLLRVCRLGCAQSDIRWEQQRPLPREVEGDRTFWCQILQNLVRAPAACSLTCMQALTPDLKRRSPTL